MKGMSDPFSSDSEDVPLHIVSSRKESFVSEDIPLDLIAMNNSDSEDGEIGSLMSCDGNFSASLLKPTLQKCEFCDDIFTTRLASIRHNSSHIVIPLLKLTVHQCDQCLFHFTSLNDLRNHVTTKNHKTSQISNKTSQLSKAEHKEILQSIVQKQVIVRCEDTLSEILNQSAYKTNNNIVNVETVPTPPSITTDTRTVAHVVEISSDSESEPGEIDICNSDTEETKNCEGVKNGPKRENLERGNGHLEEEFGNNAHCESGTKNRTQEREKKSPERDSSPELEIITLERKNKPRERDSSSEVEIDNNNLKRIIIGNRRRSHSSPEIERITPDSDNGNINRILFGNLRRENGDSGRENSSPERDNCNIRREQSSPEIEISTQERENTSKEGAHNILARLIFGTRRRNNSSPEIESIIPDSDNGSMNRTFISNLRKDNDDSGTENSTPERDKEHLRKDDSSTEVVIITPERDNNNLTKILVGNRRKHSSLEIESIRPVDDNDNVNRIFFGNLRREHGDLRRENRTPEQENGSLRREQSNPERKNSPKAENGNPKKKIGRPRKKNHNSVILEEENGNLIIEMDNSRKEHDNPARGFGKSRRKHSHPKRERSNSKSPEKNIGNPERELSNSKSPERERENSNLRTEHNPARGIGKRRRDHKKDKEHTNVSSLQREMRDLERKISNLRREHDHSANRIGKRRRKNGKPERKRSISKTPEKDAANLSREKIGNRRRKHGYLERNRSNSKTLERENDDQEKEISNSKTKQGNREREIGHTPQRDKGNLEREISNSKKKQGSLERADGNILERNKTNQEKEISNSKRINWERENSNTKERDQSNLQRGISNLKRTHGNWERENGCILEREKSISESENDNLVARGNGKSSRKHGSLYRERSNSSSPVRDDGNPEREMGSQKRKHRHQTRGIGNPRQRNSNPARGICNPRKRRKIQGNTERESFSHEERSSDPKRDHVYPERAQSSPATDNGIVDRVNSPEREYVYIEREHFNAERDLFNTVREDANAEREHFNTKREHYNTEREHVNTEIDNDTSERENSSSETEDQRSSSFDRFRLEMSSPSQLTNPSSPLEPISNRILFEDDYYDDDLFEPDKPCQPSSCTIGTKANSSQTREIPDLYSYTSNREKEKIVPDLYSYTSSRDKKRHTIWIPNSFTNTDLKIREQTVPGLNSSNREIDRGTIWIPNTLTNRDPDWNPNYFIIGSHKPLEENINEIESFAESEPYNELIEPMLCHCRYCGRCFGNRFALIKHETTHMRIKPKTPILCCVCERYLSGNHWTLRRHMERYHPHSNSKRKRQRCKICHFTYHNYQKHSRYYHVTFCDTCHRSFDRDNLHAHNCMGFSKSCNLGDSDLTPDTKVVKMCEMCLAFAKNKRNVHYDVIGVHSEVGSRQECDQCHNMCFEVNLVRRTIVRSREMHLGQTWGKKKPLSNEERLKKMQNRLKMANKINKH